MSASGNDNCSSFIGPVGIQRFDLNFSCRMIILNLLLGDSNNPACQGLSGCTTASAREIRVSTAFVDALCCVPRVRMEWGGRFASCLAPSWLKHVAAAFWARRGDIGQNRSREMFNVTTSFAFPREHPFFFGMIEQLQRLLRVITYFFDDLPECF